MGHSWEVDCKMLCDQMDGKKRTGEWALAQAMSPRTHGSLREPLLCGGAEGRAWPAGTQPWPGEEPMATHARTRACLPTLSLSPTPNLLLLSRGSDSLLTGRARPSPRPGMEREGRVPEIVTALRKGKGPRWTGFVPGKYWVAHGRQRH